MNFFIFASLAILAVMPMGQAMNAEQLFKYYEGNDNEHPIYAEPFAAQALPDFSHTPYPSWRSSALDQPDQPDEAQTDSAADEAKARAYFRFIMRARRINTVSTQKPYSNWLSPGLYRSSDADADAEKRDFSRFMMKASQYKSASPNYAALPMNMLGMPNYYQPHPAYPSSPSWLNAPYDPYSARKSSPFDDAKNQALLRYIMRHSRYNSIRPHYSHFGRQQSSWQ